MSYDNPWKLAVQTYLRPFFAFFFPAIEEDIDWSREPRFLDKELLQVLPESEVGTRFADMLIAVHRRSGGEAWVLIHIEIQASKDSTFDERMWVYHYKIFDLFRRPLASLAILADADASWRPDHYQAELWGCRARLDFPIAKLIDFEPELDSLEASDNPFALIVAAHLRALRTSPDSVVRKEFKVTLVLSLYSRGWGHQGVAQIFRILDWLLKLSIELDRQFWSEIKRYEEEKGMPFLSPTEIRFLEEGRQVGIKEGIKEGRAEVARGMIAEGIDVEVVKKLTSLSPGEWERSGNTSS